MITADEKPSDPATPEKIISEKIKSLDNNAAKVRIEVASCFEDLINALKTREKQLLRQIEAVHTQQLSIVQSNPELLGSAPSIAVNLDKNQVLRKSILEFGAVELPDKDSIVVKDAEPYKVQEYEEANKDHISFDKSIKITISEGKIDPPGDLTASGANSQPSSTNTSFISHLETDLNSSTDSTINGKPIETGNNNFSPVSSPLATLGHDKLPQYTPERLNNSNLCSSIITPAKEAFVDAPDDESCRHVAINLSSEYLNNNDSLAEHPQQIQQWLQQILVETETEPAVHELEQFVEISQSRYRDFQFSVET